MKPTKKQLKNKKMTVTVKQYEDMHRRATENAVAITQLFPLWVLRTRYNFGEKRLREFMAHYAELTEAFNEGYLTLPDIAQQLEKETGIRLGEEDG